MSTLHFIGGDREYGSLVEKFVYACQVLPRRGHPKRDRSARGTAPGDTLRIANHLVELGSGYAVFGHVPFDRAIPNE
jgi:hypothetical protein